MSWGELRWTERERLIMTNQAMRTQLSELLARARAELTEHDVDLAKSLEEFEKITGSPGLETSTLLTLQQLRKEQSVLQVASMRIQEVLRELQRRNLLRAQRRRELQNLAQSLQQQWHRLRSRFRHYRKQGEEALQQGLALVETLSHYDLAQPQVYRKLKERLQHLPQVWDQWLLRDAQETLKQELAQVDLSALAWEALSTESAPEFELPMPPERQQTHSPHLHRRLAALHAFLSAQEIRELEGLPAEALEEALLEHEIRLQTLQAEAQALLRVYHDSQLLAPFLRRLEQALEQQDWSQVRLLLPQIQQRTQDPAWAEAMTLEAFFREYLPHYRIHWERPGTVMLVEGDDARARIQVDPRSRTAYVEPERETAQFCHNLEELARRTGLTWHPQNRRMRDQARRLSSPR